MEVDLFPWKLVEPMEVNFALVGVNHGSKLTSMEVSMEVDLLLWILVKAFISWKLI